MRVTAKQDPEKKTKGGQSGYYFTDEEERVRKLDRAIREKTASREAFYTKSGNIRVQRASEFSNIVNCSQVARYIKYCAMLGLDPYDLLPLDNFYENRQENIMENKIMSMYFDLNMKGRLRFMEMLGDIWNIEKYRRH